MKNNSSFLIELPQIKNQNGNLCFLESYNQLPFEIKRVYYLFDVPGGAVRGGHAHKELEQFVIAMSGSFDVVIDDGRTRKSFHLDRSYSGLYIPPMHWRELNNFSSGSVCLVVASLPYEESDYIREYGQFVKEKQRNG